MIDLHRIFLALPYPAKVAAASMRGSYLRNWRYGRDHEQRVEKVLERDSWSAQCWSQWQEERLAHVLHRTAAHVPYYRNQWSARRRNGDRASSGYLENWPILEKELLRENPAAFVADDCNVRAMYHEHTSGTSGSSLDLWWSRETVREWYALFEARARRWHGVTRKDRWAILGGQLVTPVERHHPPFWVWNAALNQLYMSSYHLAPDLITAYLDALVKYRICYMLGYTSSLYALASEVLRLGREDLHMRVTIANAEPVLDYQREIIEQAFHCRLRETYGMAEIVAAASECAQDRLHLWPEVGIVEVVDGISGIPMGQSGDLVCTGLLNADMPLIRYRVGDAGTLAESDETCECGRNLPLIQSIAGRVDDMLYTADGRRVGRLDPIFKARLPVREAQIIQEELRRVRVLYVPTSDYTIEAGMTIVERLQARMGQIDVVLEEVDKVPRESNGKFRAVVSHLSADQIEQIKQQQYGNT